MKDSTDKKYHRKLLTEKYPIRKEDRLLELFDGLEIEINEGKNKNVLGNGEKNEDCIFWVKNNKYYFKYKKIETLNWKSS